MPCEYSSSYEINLYKIGHIPSKWPQLEGLNIAGDLVGEVGAVILPKNLEPLPQIPVELTESMPAELPIATSQHPPTNQ